MGTRRSYSNTTGYNNTANGIQAGQYIADGVTANQTSSNSVYEGYQAYPLADGDTNENVIGNTAIGHGSNTTTLGKASITDTYLAGTVHGTSFTGNAATATTAAALSVPLAHAIVFPDPNAGAVYTASQVLSTFFSPMAGTVPAGGAGTYNGVAATSVCNLGTAATASTTFTFADNGTSFGTVVFAATGTTGTFTISSAKAIASGDKITLTATGNSGYNSGRAELLARVCVLRDNMKRLILILILAATSTASASTEYLRPTADATANWRGLHWDNERLIVVNERCLQRQERQWPYRFKRDITQCELLRRLTLFGASVHHLADGPHRKRHYALHLGKSLHSDRHVERVHLLLNKQWLYVDKYYFVCCDYTDHLLCRHHWRKSGKP